MLNCVQNGGNGSGSEEDSDDEVNSTMTFAFECIGPMGSDNDWTLIAEMKFEDDHGSYSYIVINR